MSIGQVGTLETNRTGLIERLRFAHPSFFILGGTYGQESRNIL